MANLQITYAELRREIGRFLGYGRDPSDWTADGDEETDVEDVLRSGMRSFYWPPVASEGRFAWSFLRKVGTIVTASGTRDYNLPTDFGGVMEELAYSAGSGRVVVSRTTEDEIRALYGRSDASGAPQYFGLRAIQPGAGASSLYEMFLYPVPNAAYTLSFRYAIEPEELSTTNLYHLGGAVHSETVLESCLAAAEKTMDDEGNGLHAQRFQQCLASSVKIDMEMQ